MRISALADTVSKHWAQIGELTVPVANVNPMLGQIGKLFAYIDLSAVDQKRKIINSARLTPAAEAPSRARQLVQAGDVLVSTVRPNLNGVARVERQHDGHIASTGFCVLRPRQDKLDTGFLRHWVSTPTFVKSMIRMATGASYPAVSDAIVRRSLMPCPSLSEQRRIAAVLDQADALRAKRQTEAAQLDQMTTALFASIFGAGFAADWPRVSLGTLLISLTSGSRGWATYYAESGDMFLRIQNVRRNGLNLDNITYVRAPNTAESRRTLVRSGDVLLSITADLGRTAVVPPTLGRAYTNQHLAILRQTELNPVFLSAFLASVDGQQQIARLNKSGVKAGLNFDDVRSIQIPVPPRKLQDRYDACCAQVANVGQRFTAATAATNELFASLQHRAFRGEL